MPRTKVKNQEIRQQRKSQILDAALKILARNGLKGTKVSQIARSVGVSHGLVFEYFKTKEDIFAELIRRNNEHIEALIGMAMKAPDPSLKIETLLEIFFRNLMANENASDFFMIGIQAALFENTPDEAKRVAPGGPPVFRFFMDQIMEGQNNGTIMEGDPVFLSLVLASLMIGLGVIFDQHMRADPMFQLRPELIIQMLRKKDA